MTSVNSLLNALSQGDQIKDFQHASRLFIDNNYELQPRYSNLFHVVFNFTPQAASLFDNIDKLEMNMLVKSVDLPSFNIDVQTHNQYNRQVHSQHKLNYNPVNVVFHDDQRDLIRSVLHTYANFFYNDSKYALGNGAYSTNDRYSGYRGNEFGFSDGNQRFFKDIRIYSMLQKRFAEYTLINPIINAFGHDTHSYANSSLMQHTMNIQYETVKYATGFVNNINPKGFTDVHYDNSPSPLGVFGGGVTDSIFYQGGLVDAINTVTSDLASGNLLGAIIKGSVIFNNTKDADLGRVFEKDLERAVGSILRGKNPLTDVILPTALVGDNNRVNTGEGLSGTGSPVDRTALFGNNSPSGVVSSNRSNIFNTAFNLAGSFFSDPFNMGNGTVVPKTTRSAGSFRKLSDGDQRDLTNSSNTKARKKTEIANRVLNLTRLLNNDPSNSSLKKEISDLSRQASLQFGKTSSESTGSPASTTTTISSTTTDSGESTSTSASSSSTGSSYI